MFYSWQTIAQRARARQINNLERERANNRENTHTVPAPREIERVNGPGMSYNAMRMSAAGKRSADIFITAK
jgi:hypothetical protein